MKAQFLFLSLLSASLVFSGCKDDDDDKVIPNPPPPTPTDSVTTGRIAISLDHRVAGQPLVLNAANYYTSPGGQQYRVSDFRYYFSNVKFMSNNLANIYMEPESYHFINHSQPGTLKFNIEKVAPGTYDSLLFAIGVDNNRNHTGAQTGALDPVHGMSWGWVTGYKFLQIEGSSPSAPGPTNTILYHIGHNQNYRVVRIGLNPAITVAPGSKHTINLSADVNRIFGTPADPLLFDQVHTVMGVQNSELLSDNYRHMFTFESIAAE